MEAATNSMGLFGPDSVTWKVNSEAVLLLGGGRALILQVAHPKVAAGVSEHSNYREEPWTRLYRTLDTTLKIVFGDPDTSRDAAERLHRRHTQVTGTDDRGEPYEALDPDLLLWVHATLIETSMLMYERYVKPLTAADRAGYYEEMKTLGEAYGIPREHHPADYPAFRDYFSAMLDSELRVTDALLDVADATLHPPLPFIARPVVEMVNLVTVGTLPAELRERMGLEWSRRRERLLAASQTTIRGLLPLLPGLLRRFPPARHARRRARAEILVTQT